MRRGTTPTLTFTTPYAADLIESGYITFNQRGSTVLDVPLSDPSVTIADESISITLTQEQTLSFDQNVATSDWMNAKAAATVQIRAVLTSGKAVASNIVQVPICAILKDGEI